MRQFAFRAEKEENLLIQYYEILELSSFRYKSDILSNIF